MFVLFGHAVYYNGKCIKKSQPLIYDLYWTKEFLFVVAAAVAVVVAAAAVGVADDDGGGGGDDVEPAADDAS